MPKGKPSKSTDLVPIGPRQVFSNAAAKTKERRKRPEKATTTRALVLRNAARGTGEIVLVSRMTGREKLDLLAEDLLEKSRRAVMRPFRLEDCLKIAGSQCDVYVDDIANLRDPELFHHIIEAELQARNPPARENVRKNPSYVAKVVSTRLHNSYMLASAWKIVFETFNDFATNGITDQNIKNKLKQDFLLRDRYLVLWDMVNTLVELSQNIFALLATTAPHYAGFFKLKPTENLNSEELEYIFDWKDLRKVADSFIDSIIIELCFPRGKYPKAVLYQLLGDAVSESPKDAKRFPQALWDAMGHLSVSLQLKELLDAPLFGVEGDIWKNHPRRLTADYELWIDAQFYSNKASDMFANFKDVIFPLEKTRKHNVLDTMWKNINLNYQSVSGKDVDTLWNLTDNLNYAPQWTSYFVPGLHKRESDDRRRLEHTVKKNTKKKDVLRITNEEHASTDSDMPVLQSVSNSEDEDDDEDDDDDYDLSEGEDEEMDESDYDTDEEDVIRELLREAMDAAHEVDWISGGDIPKEINPLEQENRKANPFLRLLGSLRGRMFSSNPKLKSTTTTESGPGREPTAVPSTTPGKGVPATQTVETKTAPKPFKATVEDASDEEPNVTGPKKKKKKKSKKKMKPASSDSSPSLQPLQASVSSATISGTSSAPASPKTMTSSNQQASAVSPVARTPSFMSSTSTITTPVQSGHSYVQSQGIKVEKKLKSRPDHSSLFNPNPEDKKKKGPFSGFSLTKGKAGKEDMKEAKQSWFSKLGKKANTLMHQLLGKSPETRGSMKWDDFVKLMKEMGFTYDPSTAGSSVRFDPPCKGDPPITFHKPHPDSTLKPIMLKDFASRLRRRYGWGEADLAKLA